MSSSRALAASSGYWQYVRTDVHEALATRMTASETQSGVEGNYTVVQTTYYYGTSTVDAVFGVDYTWPKPPAVLVPGVVINMPVAASVTQNQNPADTGMGGHFTGTFYPYQATSNLDTFIPYASTNAFWIDIFNNTAAGAQISFNNATLAQPQKYPDSTMADSNGYMTLLVAIELQNYYYWSYVYQWVSGTPPSGTTSITINNPGFETLPANPAWISCVGNGGPGSGGTGCRDTSDGNIPGWTASNTTSIGLFQPGPNYFTLPLPAAEGQTILQMNSGTLSQVLSTTLQTSTLYTLSVDNGRRLDNVYPSPPPTAQLFAGTTLIASATGSEPPLGGWTTWTGTYQSSASDSLAGQSLKIVLGTTSAQANFDNVQLTAATAGGGTTTGSCTSTCNIGASVQTIAASGGTGTIAVTATGAWTAVSLSSWIKITSGASGTGNGTVSFTVSANTGPPEVGAISVAGLTYTIYQSGTATGTTTGCNYLIQSNTTQEIPVTGTSSGFIQVVTAQTCSWTATTTSGASWIDILSGQSVTGNGAVAYSVPPNTTGAPRNGGIIIAGQIVAITQDGGVLTGAPGITAGGIVNTASYAPGGPPNGSLAEGSFFSIFGSTLGPASGVAATSYPLPISLGSVSVKVTSGPNSYDCYMVFAAAGQINAILPSTVPPGTAQLVVTYNGIPSSPATITVATTSLGIFFEQMNGANMAIAQNVASATSYPLNLPSVPAQPGQIVILWGTGMGPISAADNVAPPAGDMSKIPVVITVGGVSAQRLYAGRQPQTAGVDNIYFTVPSGVPYGCQVPVAVTAGGIPANTTVIAITKDGSPCQ